MLISFRKFLMILMVTGSCSFFISCSSTPERGKVAREWSLAMRELQINPIFPPREDFYVGDVYVLPTTPDRLKRYMERNNEFIPIGSRVGYINLTKEVIEEYKNRPSFPSTTEAKITELKSVLHENGIETAKQKEIIDEFIKSWIADEKQTPVAKDPADPNTQKPAEEQPKVQEAAKTDTNATDTGTTESDTVKGSDSIEKAKTQSNESGTQYTVVFDTLDDKKENVVYPIVTGKPYKLKLELSKDVIADDFEWFVYIKKECIPVCNIIEKVENDKLTIKEHEIEITERPIEINIQAKKENTNEYRSKKRELEQKEGKYENNKLEIEKLDKKRLEALRNVKISTEANKLDEAKFYLKEAEDILTEINKLIDDNKKLETEINAISKRLKRFKKRNGEPPSYDEVIERKLKIPVYAPIAIKNENIKNVEEEVSKKFTVSMVCNVKEKKTKWVFYNGTAKINEWNGLKFSENGKIEGKPTIAKAIKITPKVYYDGTKNCEFLTKDFWIIIKPEFKTSSALQMSRVKDYYYTKLELTKFEGYDLSWEFSVNDNKWNGLTFNTKTGEIVGKPESRDFLAFTAIAKLSIVKDNKVEAEAEAKETFYILVGENVFTNRDLTRLREVSFPSFMSTTFSYSQLGGLVPIEAVGLIFGSETQSRYYVSVNIPSAESYGVSNLNFIKKYLKYDGSSRNILELKHLNKLVPKEQKDYLLENVCYVDIITEVYYARAIDISITSNNAIKLESILGKSESEKKSEIDYVKLTQALNEKMKIPGAKLKFGSVSQYSVSMRRVFNRPIAIGYRGLRLKLECKEKDEVSIVSVSTIGNEYPEPAKGTDDDEGEAD